MTLNLPERESEYLERVSKEKDMSKTSVIRQALRLYQVIDDRLKTGEQMAFTKNGELVKQIIFGCGDLG